MKTISTRLLIAESAVTRMNKAAQAAHPYETGGILIGVHADGQPWVALAVELPSRERGRAHYKLPAGATQPAVLEARQADARLGYLGDWHSHPEDVGPSTTDLTTLSLISIWHPLKPNPNLIVVRRTGDTYALDARRIVGISPRPCEVRATGDLPPAVEPGYQPSKEDRG